MFEGSIWAVSTPIVTELIESILELSREKVMRDFQINVLVNTILLYTRNGNYKFEIS